LNDANASEYQYRSWFVNLLMEELFLDLVKFKLNTGEIDNEQRKIQRDLTAPPKDHSGGWFHDGILTINLNGIYFNIGILEVVSNAIKKDNDKLLKDRAKMLKAMRLGFHHLENFLHDEGVVDRERTREQLETFGILVDRKEFLFYLMHYYEGIYLVDEISNSFIIPDNSTQLYLLNNVISKLVSFRARVEHLNLRIKNLLNNKITNLIQRRKTTVIEIT